MSSVNKPSPEVEASSSYPRSWVWDVDGDLCSDTFVRFDQGPTRGYGPKPIAVLRVAGEERSVWLMQTALYGSFRNELTSRSLPELVPGERVVIQRKEMKPNAAGTATYRDFDVHFPDRPQASVSELFDLGGKPTSEVFPEVEAQPDDDIPF